MTKSSGTLARRTFDEEVVLDAAAHVFRKRGYGGATVREVAQAAGMLPGSLHYRYPSKEALLLDLMERALNRVLGSGRAAVESARDPVERLRLALRAHLEALLSGDDDFYVLLYDWRSLQGPAMNAMLRLRSRYEQFWDDLLQDAIRAGWARPGIDAELLRQFGFGALNWVAQWRQENDPRTAEQIADAFWSYLAFGLLAEDKRRQLLGKPLGQMTKRKGRT
ncbi:MAG TPA: TetR/AcrR family transcriptional regulator [Myxococcales bacterium]|nr:TetR/AcrR family transcriptional regulator [Myxococcales bacterium]